MLTEILSKLSKTTFSKYQSASTLKLLFDIQMWLIQNRQAIVSVVCIDDFDSWGYRILIADSVRPFFEPEYDKLNCCPSYEDALESGILKTLDILDLCNLKQKKWDI